MCACVCVLKENILRERNKDRNPIKQVAEGSTNRQTDKPTDRRRIDRDSGGDRKESEKEREKRERKREKREREKPIKLCASYEKL